MTLNDYRDQFKKNLMIMSRTANGKLDLSASETKIDSMAEDSADNAKNLALANTDRAIRFLYENRRRKFKSAEELDKLILETPSITAK